MAKKVQIQIDESDINTLTFHFLADDAVKRTVNNLARKPHGISAALVADLALPRVDCFSLLSDDSKTRVRAYLHTLANDYLRQRWGT